MKWLLIKLLFRRDKLYKSLKRIGDDDIVEMYKMALDREEFEIAAILKYYTEFKRGDHND